MDDADEADGVAPGELWRAVLARAADDVRRLGGSADGVAVRPGSDVVVLWDRDTLGSPRPVLGGDLAPALTWLAEHEPHTWALVVDGTYAVGGLGSYLVARMTRGLDHVTDVASAARTGLLDPATATWSAERCAAHGVPLDALPEVARDGGAFATTEPSTFLGLAVPITWHR